MTDSVKFVDLVREATLTRGTGNLELRGSPEGYRRFADTLQPGDSFYYSILNPQVPRETETGIGRLEDDGTLSRTPTEGDATDFSAGAKIVSLVVGAPWFEQASAGSGSLALDGKSDVGHGHQIADVAGLQTILDGLGSGGTSGGGGIAGFVSVREHGAAGDGTSDDTAAIQAALDAAQAAGKGVHFPEGDYLVDATVGVTMPAPAVGGLVVPSGSHLTGVPGRSRIVVMANDLPKTAAVSCYDVENVLIENLTIVGDRVAHTYPNRFLSLADLQARTNWATKDHGGATFEPYEGMIAVVLNDNGGPSLPEKGEYRYQSGNWVRSGDYDELDYITHEFGYGIFINKSRNVTVRNCTIEDCTGDGIFIGEEGGSSTGVTRSVHVLGCRLTGHRRQGISVVRGDDIVIAGNSFRDIGYRVAGQDGAFPKSAVDVEAGWRFKSHNVVVANNSVERCASGNGLIAYDCIGATFAHNVLRDCGLSNNLAVLTNISGNTIMNGGVGIGSLAGQTAFTYTQSGTVVTVTTTAAHGRVDGQRDWLEFLDANGRVAVAGEYVIRYVSGTQFTADIGVALDLTSGGGRRYFPGMDTLIEGNQILEGTVSIAGRNVMMRGNLVRNSGARDAVNINATSADFVTIAGNHLIGGARGVGGANGSGRITVENNLIAGMKSDGVVPCGTDQLVRANRFRDNSRDLNCGTSRAIVVGNLFEATDATTTATSVNSGGTAVHQYRDNIWTPRAGHAIFANGPMVATNNRVLANAASAALFLTANADHSVIARNDLEANRGNLGPIYAAAGADGLRIIGNYLTNKLAMGAAISSGGGADVVIAQNVHQGTIQAGAGDRLEANVAV